MKRTVQNTNDEANIVPRSKREKHQPKHKIAENDEAYIRMHIKKFNPCVSHYRREHAPNRWYLPSELSCTEMFEDYQICCEEENRKAFSYIKYWQIIKEMNISFTKLGIEECELCDAYTIHTQEHKKRLREAKKQSKTNKKEDRNWKWKWKWSTQ